MSNNQQPSPVATLTPILNTLYKFEYGMSMQEYRDLADYFDGQWQDTDEE